MQLHLQRGGTWQRLQKAWIDSRAYLYPVGVSFWVALIFTERFVFDSVTTGQARSVSNALPLSVLCVLAPAWVMTAMALLASRRIVSRGKSTVGKFVRNLAHEVLTPRILVVAAVALIVIKWAEGHERGRSLLGALHAVYLRLYAMAPSRTAVSILGLGGACFLVFYLASQFLKGRKSTAVQTMQELIVSGYFILANAVVYILVYDKFIMIYLPASQLADAFAELIKDTLIYSIVALAIVVGTFKAERLLRLFRKPSERGWALALMALATIACAVPALALDVLFIGKVQGGEVRLYSLAEQRHWIHFHIMFRDFCLIVPLIVAAFLRLLLEVVKLNEETRRRRARARELRRMRATEMGGPTT